MDYTNLLSKRARLTRSSPLDDILKDISGKPDIISFAIGMPNTDLLPVEVLETLNQRVTEKYGRSVLQYGIAKGFPPLLAAVQHYLRDRGIVATVATSHISTGCSGALNNTCMTLLDPGDEVLVEDPTYPVALETFRAYEARVTAVDCDDEGMIPEALEKCLNTQRVKVLYLIPNFQNPTGRVMPLERRKSIAALARRNGVLIIEDDVYRDLRYEGENVPALQALAPENVLYVGSASKIFAPAMRVGFAILPEPILEKFLILKHDIDLNTSHYTQALTAEFLLSNEFEAYLSRVRQNNSSKLQAMLAALERYMPAGYSWTKPEGGLFVWVTGPKSFDAEALLERALAAGVAYAPGNSFFADQSRGKNTMRLSFAQPTIANIDQGVSTLAKLCTSAV